MELDDRWMKVVVYLAYNLVDYRILTIHSQMEYRSFSSLLDAPLQISDDKTDHIRTFVGASRSNIFAAGIIVLVILVVRAFWRPRGIS